MVPLTDVGRAFKTKGGAPQSTPEEMTEEEDRPVSQPAGAMTAVLT